MRHPAREDIERIRQEYPQGTRIELLQMDDSQAPPPGTIGTVDGVTGVYDVGSILMSWDNGSSLKVILGQDRIRKVKD